MKRPRAEEKESTAKTTATTAADGGGGGGRPSPRLYVGGLHKSVKEGEILRLFVPHGRVVKEEYPFHMHGPRKGEPRGYAFVEYETTAEAARAMAALDGKEFKGGRRLQVRFVREQGALPTDPRAFLAKAKAAKTGGTATAADGAASGGSGAGGGSKRRREESSEESALDAKIRALKAMLQKK